MPAENVRSQQHSSMLRCRRCAPTMCFEAGMNVAQRKKNEKKEYSFHPFLTQLQFN